MNDTYQPSPDDVEAAADLIDRMSAPDSVGRYADADVVARAVLREAHARGWRDAAEVAAIEADRDRWKANHDCQRDIKRAALVRADLPIEEHPERALTLAEAIRGLRYSYDEADEVARLAQRLRAKAENDRDAAEARAARLAEALRNIMDAEWLTHESESGVVWNMVGTDVQSEAQRALEEDRRCQRCGGKGFHGIFASESPKCADCGGTGTILAADTAEKEKP